MRPVWPAGQDRFSNGWFGLLNGTLMCTFFDMCVCIYLCMYVFMNLLIDLSLHILYISRYIYTHCYTIQ